MSSSTRCSRPSGSDGDRQGASSERHQPRRDRPVSEHWARRRPSACRAVPDEPRQRGGRRRLARRRMPCATDARQRERRVPGERQPGRARSPARAANGTDAAACPSHDHRPQHQPRGPADQPSAPRRPAGRGGGAVATAPTAPRCAHRSITSGTSGTTSTLAAGATSESRSKLTQDDGQGGQLRGEGQRHRLAEPAPASGEARLERRPEQDQAGGRERRELEADVPQHRGRGQRA